MIKTKDIHKSFGALEVLKGIDLSIDKGEVVSIVGPSGAGKTTLLQILGTLSRPTSGEIEIDGVAVHTLSDKNISKFRNTKIGFVFQSYNLLPKTTALENVELPLFYNPSVSARDRKERSINALHEVGLADGIHHRSNQMSGGQQQRVAIARALVNDPVMILADEATGNLDTRTSFEILTLFQKLHREGRTIVFVTHNPEIAEFCSRNIVLRDGRIVEDVQNTQVRSAKEVLDSLPQDSGQ
mgnify:CR=1 FL=1